jgi:3',5'-cyclic-AMP phosphodiesterase
MDVTTVADDLIVAHDGTTVIRLDGLAPRTTHRVGGAEVTTLERPAGELLCRVATVNDIHFGELECGRIDDHPIGPILRVAEGEEPYPETMNRGAVAEIAAAEVDAVVAKGDLSTDGTPEEFAAFEHHYRTTFGEHLYVIRGNHDAYRRQPDYAGDHRVELPGVILALLDTVNPGHSGGLLHADQLDWLDEVAATADRPVLVLGHHQQWIEGPRDPGYFGIEPDSSEALGELIARRPAVVAYAAGHTHRHRIRRMPGSGVPSIEVGCVKDFPGVWAEYRVYEGGITQLVHRISTPDALAWSERCRGLYSDFGLDYASYALGSLEDRCCNIPLR